MELNLPGVSVEEFSVKMSGDLVVERKTVNFNLNLNETEEERLISAIINLQEEFQSN